MERYIKQLVESVIREMINEGRYDRSTSPYNHKSEIFRDRGTNPSVVDVGNHSANDTLSQPSTYDKNGKNFVSDEHIVLSDNMFTIYKIKNFGTDSIESTMSLFGSGAQGEKELRRALDVLNGGADRNNRNIRYRTITSVSNNTSSQRSEHMRKTFWEFSVNNGEEWYILKPDPIVKMKPSTLKRK